MTPFARAGSVKRAFMLVVVPLVLAAVVGFLTLFEVQVQSDARAALRDKLSRSLNSTSIILARAVWARDQVQIATHAAPSLVDPELIGIFIYDRDGQALAEFGSRDHPTADTLVGQTAIRYAIGSSLEDAGELVMVMTDASVRDAFYARLPLLIGFAILLIISMVLATLVAFDLVVGRALRDLRRVIDQIHHGSDRKELNWQVVAEVAEVVDAFNRLQRRQGAYETALDQARQDLERRVDERTGELKRARDEARAASDAKSAFLANMSHELRTPLNAIIGFAGILKNEKYGRLTDPRYSDYAEIVLSSGNHLLDLINDLLDLSKADSGGLVPMETVFSMVDQARRAVGMSQTQIEEAGLEVEVVEDPSIADVRADARLVLQLISNLVTNAVKFTANGGRITVHVAMDQRRSVSVVVTDTGIGIPSDQIGRVMEPFTQLDTRLHREHRGAGLGLPLCRAIARAHGGRLTIDSEPGVGTAITFTLPPWRSLPPSTGTERLGETGTEG